MSYQKLAATLNIAKQHIPEPICFRLVSSAERLLDCKIGNLCGATAVSRVHTGHYTK